MGVNLIDGLKLARAKARIHQKRPTRWAKDGEAELFFIKGALPEMAEELWAKGYRPVKESYVDVGEPEEVFNVKTTVGIDFAFAQTYSTAPGANGLNYIALSNDAVSETSGSTTLSNEIAANGLSRAQGTYAHTNGTSTATIDHTFTCATSNQSCQKAALFSASSSGTMQHVLGFTQRNLIVGDTIDVTFTITLT